MGAQPIMDVDVDQAGELAALNGCITTLEALWMGVPVVSLAVLRKGMRTMLRISPLLNGQRLARDLETAYREMWHVYENGKRTASCDLSG